MIVMPGTHTAVATVLALPDARNRASKGAPASERFYAACVAGERC